MCLSWFMCPSLCSHCGWKSKFLNDSAVEWELDLILDFRRSNEAHGRILQPTLSPQHKQVSNKKSKVKEYKEIVIQQFKDLSVGSRRNSWNHGLKPVNPWGYGDQSMGCLFYKHWSRVVHRGSCNTHQSAHRKSAKQTKPIHFPSNAVILKVGLISL